MSAEWDDLARLAEAASKATHGLPWVKDPDAPDKVLASKNGGWDGSLVATVASDDFDLVEEDVTEFIAAANPATILRLITDNRNLRHTTEADLEYQRRLEARLAAVEALADEWDEKAVVLARQSESRAGLSDAAALAAAAEFYAARAANLRAALAAPTDTTKEN